MKTSSNDLKDLKRMLKASSPAQPEGEHREEQHPTVRNVRKKKNQDPVSQPSDCASILGIKVGSRVVLMDADIHGKVIEIKEKMVRIQTDDGLMMLENIYNLAPSDPEQEKALAASVQKIKASVEKEKKKVRADEDLVVDLHIEALPCGRNINENCRLEYQMEVFKRTMRENMKHRGKKITFIHGVGDGILKHAILKELEEVYALSCTWNPYHSGATTVTIR